MDGCDHHRAVAGNGSFNAIPIVEGFIITKANGFHVCADCPCQVANAVTKNTGGKRQYPVVWAQAALQRAPQCQHSFTGQNGNLVAGRHHLLQVLFCLVVNVQELGFKVTGAIIHLVSCQHIRVNSDGSGNHGNGIRFHGITSQSGETLGT